MRKMVINRYAEINLGPDASETDKLLDRAPLHEMSDARLLKAFEELVRDVTIKEEESKTVFANIGHLLKPASFRKRR